MSLFEAAVDQVVKDVGDKTSIEVADRTSADHCRILSVIERKHSLLHLPWNSSDTYVTTKIGLNDLLVEPVDASSLKTTSTVLFENYVSTPSFHKDGKIGVKIAEEFGVDVSVNEMMEVSLKLGNVMKTEIPWQVLYNTVHNKKIKMDHPLIEMVQKSKEKSLFVINMIVTAGSEVVLNETEEEKTDGGLDGKPQVALNLNASASSDTKQHRQYSIPRGTCFGYSCYKMKIGKDGLLTLKLGEDVVDAPPPAPPPAPPKSDHENSAGN